MSGIMGDDEWETDNGFSVKAQGEDATQQPTFVPRNPLSEGHASLDLSKLPAASFSDVLKQHKVPLAIDFFSLDVEGAEHLVLRSFPFEKYSCLIITIERPKAETTKLLLANGYRLYKQLYGVADMMYGKK